MITVPLESRHLSVIAAIEAAQLPNPLNLRNLQELSSRPAFRGFVAVLNSSADPMGYVLVLAGGGSADIVSVAVAPELLRRGVAKGFCCSRLPISQVKASRRSPSRSPSIMRRPGHFMNGSISARLGVVRVIIAGNASWSMPWSCAAPCKRGALPPCRQSRVLDPSSCPA